MSRNKGVLLQPSLVYRWSIPLLTEVVWDGSVTGAVGGSGGMTDAEFSAHLPLPVLATIDTTGLATSAGQTAGNASLSSIDGKLTNPLPVSGTVTTGGLTDTQLRASAVPVSLASIPINAAAATAAIQATQQTTLDAIKAKTDNLPPLGQALAAASTPVILPAATITTLTPPAAITGFATSTIQTTQQTALDAIQARAALLLADTTFTGRINTQGQKTSAASTPVVLPTDALPPPDRMASGDITTIATSQSITTYGSGTTRVTIIGTWTGTLSFYGFDGTTAIALKAENVSTTVLESSTTVNGTWRVATAGFAAFVVLGPTSTGTASLTFAAGPGSSPMNLGQATSAQQTTAQASLTTIAAAVPGTLLLDTQTSIYTTDVGVRRVLEAQYLQDMATSMNALLAGESENSQRTGFELR